MDPGGGRSWCRGRGARRGEGWVDDGPARRPGCLSSAHRGGWSSSAAGSSGRPTQQPSWPKRATATRGSSAVTAYDRASFIEMLTDWGWTGEVEPDWWHDVVTEHRCDWCFELVGDEELLTPLGRALATVDMWACRGLRHLGACARSAGWLSAATPT